MAFVPVTQENIAEAARIHSASWQESHRSFCSEAFIAQHTPEHQENYLRNEMASGKRVWLLKENGNAVGLVSVSRNLIENLYVHPAWQNCGYGTKLLRFAIKKCEGTPALWILSNNDGARRLYERNGFALTGEKMQLSDTLCELEMQWTER